MLKRYYGHGLIILQIIADMIVILASFYLSYWIWTLSNSNIYPQPPDFSIFFLFTVIVLLIFQVVGLYEKQRSIMNIKEAEGLFKAIIFSFMIILSLSFFYRSANFIASRLLILYNICTTIILINMERYGFFKLEQHLIFKGIGLHRILIYNSGEIGKTLAKNMLQSPKLGNNPIGFVEDDDKKVGKAIKGIPVLGTIENISKIIKEHKADVLFITKLYVPYKNILEIIEKCKDQKIRFRIVPNVYELAVQKVLIEDIGGIPFIGVKEAKFKLFTQIQKRSLDIIASFIGLILLIPIFLLLSYLIKKESPGPAIFSQERTGKYGKKFKLYKFRTMYSDTPAYALTPDNKEDPRITKFGRFLRRTSLDELPQLCNVLKGEMSLVGPRPEMPFIVEKYDELTKERLNVRPGLTGLWQISADRAKQIHENIEYDLYYIENQSFLLDLAIITKTILATIRGIGAY